MPNLEWTEIATEATERDPQDYPYGYFAGGGCALDHTRVFSWFQSLDELARHILEVEPRVFDVEPGEGLEELQAMIRPITTEACRTGLCEELRVALDEALCRAFVIDWWGTFEDLCLGRGEFGRQVPDSYLGEEREGQTLPSQEVSESAAFLKEYGF